MKSLNKFLFTKEDMPVTERIGGYFFWFAFLFEITYMIFKRIGYNLPLETYWLRAVTFCFGIKVLFTRYTGKEWLFIIAGGLLGIVAYVYSGQDIIFRVYAMVAASKNISKRSAVKSLLISLGISYFVIVVRGFMGIGGPILDVRDYGRGEVETRYSLGFSHANGLHMSIWTLLALGLYLYDAKLKTWAYACLVLLDLILFYFTRSRTGFLIILFMVAAAFWAKYVQKKRSWLVLGGGIGMMVLVLSLSYVAQKYEIGVRFPQIMVPLNNMLTNRFQLAHEQASIIWYYYTPIRLFMPKGIPVNSIDMGYISCFYAYGIVYGVLLVGALLMLLIKAWRQDQRMELVLVLCMILYYFIEATQTSTPYVTQNFAWLLLIDTWYNRKSGQKEFYLQEIPKGIRIRR